MQGRMKNQGDDAMIKSRAKTSLFSFFNYHLLSGKTVSKTETRPSRKQYFLEYEFFRFVFIGACFFIFMTIFQSCATLKKEECLNINWYNIGYEDGTKGYKTARIEKHRKSCTQYGVIPDLNLYLDGHEAGITEYCTPHKGYMLGLHGRLYNDVCKGELEKPFLEGYKVGREMYLFKKEIRKERDKIDELKKELSQVLEKLTKKESLLGNDCAKQKNCEQVLDDIRRLDREKLRFRSKIKSQKKLINGMEYTLDRMKSESPF